MYTLPPGHPWMEELYHVSSQENSQTIYTHSSIVLKDPDALLFDLLYSPSIRIPPTSFSIWVASDDVDWLSIARYQPLTDIRQTWTGDQVHGTTPHRWHAGKAKKAEQRGMRIEPVRNLPNDTQTEISASPKLTQPAVPMIPWCLSLIIVDVPFIPKGISCPGSSTRYSVNSTSSSPNTILEIGQLYRNTMTKVFTLAIILLTTVVFVTAGAVRRDTDEEKTTDHLLFDISLDEFIAKKKELTGHSTLIFDSDGCTKVADVPLGFNFSASCQRHDFGYRNYEHQGRLDQENRSKINDNFKNDMYHVCDSENGTNTTQKYPCPRLDTEAANGIEELLGFLSTWFNEGGDNSGGDTTGDTSYQYSRRFVCETIAESYFDGVTIYGWINGTRKSGASGQYGVTYNACFWGICVTFLSFLMFWL
ncbi:hypothetical protein K440DRAFT_642966 [Wilcoxina mikolae CBS 423.85]|nr:hypothetical protein K440DRAFT_642966 [Wilcoxina mikolae CBS 423.85]